MCCMSTGYSGGSAAGGVRPHDGAAGGPAAAGREGLRHAHERAHRVSALAAVGWQAVICNFQVILLSGMRRKP